MLTLHQFIPNPKRPDVSVFCSKVEMFLKIHNLPYEGKQGNPVKSPKGKLPTLKDGDQLIADSEIIIRHLSEKYKIDPEPGLTPEQKSISFMIRKTLEEHLYFIVLHTRWIDPRGWSVVNGLFFGKLPAPLKLVVPHIVRRQVAKSLHLQGISRHDSAEISRRGLEVLEKLAPFVGKSDYIFGDEPTLVDCVVFPYLWGVIHFPSDNDLKVAAKANPNFVSYVDRIIKRYYN